jgi:hypothetical protein
MPERDLRESRRFGSQNGNDPDMRDRFFIVTIIKISRHETAYSVMWALGARGAGCEHVGDIAI